MDIKLIFAIVTITMALVFYTIGVFGERKAHLLTKKYLLMFWLGFICDTTGTLTMSVIAKSSGTPAPVLHGITGFIAIVLMLFHALWASWVIYKNDEAKKQSFHKFSIFVWAVWLVPYVIGMVMGMM